MAAFLTYAICVIFIIVAVSSASDDVYTVSIRGHNERIYANSVFCTAFKFDNVSATIIGIEPHATSNVVHHMLLFGCNYNAGHPPGIPWSCVNMQNICADGSSQIIYGWARDAPGVQYPPNVGKVVGEGGISYVVIQIHYRNPLISDDFGSGVDLQLTHSTQEYQIGMYTLATSSSGLYIPPGEQHFEKKIRCTYHLSNSMTIFAYRVHTHSLGRRVICELETTSGEVIELGDRSPLLPQAFVPIPERNITFGDVLSARCIFNSSIQEDAVWGGPKDSDEMCNCYLLSYAKDTTIGTCVNNGYSTLEEDGSELGPDNDITYSIPVPQKSAQPTFSSLKIDTSEFSQDIMTTTSIPIPQKTTRPTSSSPNFERNESGQDMVSTLIPSLEKTFSTVNIESSELGQDILTTSSTLIPSPAPLPTNVKLSTMPSLPSLTPSIEIPAFISTGCYILHEEWPHYPNHSNLGQVSAISTDVDGNVFIFNRAERSWVNSTFDPKTHLMINQSSIIGYTVLYISGLTGKIISEWGRRTFAMPHGLTVAPDGSLFLTDVGLHQVFQYTSDGDPLLVLGTKGDPGRSRTQFCMPTDVAVSNDGTIFVSDGYCNSRIVKFSADGKFIKDWNVSSNSKAIDAYSIPHIIHSITMDAQGLLYVVDREYGYIFCYDQDGNLEWKQHFQSRIFALDLAKDMLFGVSNPLLSQHSYGGIITLNLTTNASVHWGEGIFLQAHDIAVTRDLSSIYVADLDKKRVLKFANAYCTINKATSTDNVGMIILLVASSSLGICFIVGLGKVIIKSRSMRQSNRTGESYRKIVNIAELEEYDDIE